MRMAVVLACWRAPFKIMLGLHFFRACAAGKQMDIVPDLEDFKVPKCYSLLVFVHVYGSCVVVLEASFKIHCEPPTFFGVDKTCSKDLVVVAATTTHMLQCIALSGIHNHIIAALQ